MDLNTTRMLPKKRTALPKCSHVSEDTGEQFKRYKTTVNEAIADFVCPITLCLPIDPVVAEDGKIYERSAIVKWLDEKEAVAPRILSGGLEFAYRFGGSACSFHHQGCFINAAPVVPSK